jgi:sporulation protein YlmC with PRC-barrel domain
MPDPVAWKVVEAGWRVLDADGKKVGVVNEIAGDIEADIFDGVLVGDGGTVLSRTKYVPSEEVAAIYEGEVVLAPGATLRDP